MKTFWFLGLWALFAFSALSGLEPARGGIGENPREEIGEPDAPPDISTEQVAGPFEFPCSIAFLPEGSLLVTERVGRRCRRECGWKLHGAISGKLKLPDQAARSIGCSIGAVANVCQPSTLRMLI
jgi:hypothetical protein